VPAGITWNFWAGKAKGKSAQAVPGKPTFMAYQLIKGIVQLWCVDSPAEGWLIVISQPNDRLLPSRWIIRAASCILPEYGSSFVGPLLRKGVNDSDEPLLNKLLYFQC
jgi:hypothetical protein